MVWSIACITEEKDVFLVRISADRTGADLFLLEFVLDPGIWVEFGDLFFVLDFVFGHDGTWRKRISI